MPAFEWVHVQLHQQKGMISLSPPTICNSAVQHLGGAEMFSDRAKFGTVAKLAMRQPFVLFKGLTFQKLCLPGAFR
ncbi:hypothetical protein QJ504_19660, partial [Acinetobacter baumannii]|uniref:hypothetical protein n=1 Tax=Acinetobacter baumannii TaxID=470 RepID=UPI00249C26B4